jgi:phage terminase small subunit
MAPRPALTDQQQRFVQAYLRDSNGTAAAKAAGYSPKTSGSQANRLLKNANIRKAIGLAQEQRAEDVAIEARDILLELRRVALCDIGEAFDADGKLKPLRDIPIDVRKAMSAIKSEELFEGRGGERQRIGDVREVKFWNKVEALSLLGKHLKMFSERIDHHHVVSLEQLVAGSYKLPGES